jgi:hypothetical protein
MGRTCSTHGGEVHTGFQHDSLKERAYWEDTDVDVRIILRLILKKWDVIMRTGFI